MRYNLSEYAASLAYLPAEKQHCLNAWKLANTVFLFARSLEALMHEKSVLPELRQVSAMTIAAAYDAARKRADNAIRMAQLHEEHVDFVQGTTAPEKAEKTLDKYEELANKIAREARALQKRSDEKSAHYRTLANEAAAEIKQRGIGPDGKPREVQLSEPLQARVALEIKNFREDVEKRQKATQSKIDKFPPISNIIKKAATFGALLHDVVTNTLLPIRDTLTESSDSALIKQCLDKLATLSTKDRTNLRCVLTCFDEIFQAPDFIGAKLGLVDGCLLKKEGEILDPTSSAGETLRLFFYHDFLGSLLEAQGNLPEKSARQCLSRKTMESLINYIGPLTNANTVANFLELFLFSDHPKAKALDLADHYACVVGAILPGVTKKPEKNYYVETERALLQEIHQKLKVQGKEDQAAQIIDTIKEALASGDLSQAPHRLIFDALAPYAIYSSPEQIKPILVKTLGRGFHAADYEEALDALYVCASLPINGRHTVAYVPASIASASGVSSSAASTSGISRHDLWRPQPENHAPFESNTSSPRP